MKVILGLSNYQSGTLKLYGPMNNKHIGALIDNPGVYPFITDYENMNLINEDKEKENMEQIIKNLEMSQFVILDEPMNG